jgi:hypothetical protein
MLRVLLILFLLTIFLNGCGLIPPKFIRYNGGKQAVASAYHLSRKPFEYSSLIDTTAIYFTSERLTISNRKGEVLHRDVIYYRYLRFNSKGIAFSRNLMLEYPTVEVANAMERGQYCFYSVKDSIIKLEKFNGDTKVFEYWYGKIKSNGDIHFYKRKGRPWGTYRGRLNYVYKKTPAQLTTPIVFPTKEWENEYYF